MCRSPADLRCCRPSLSERWTRPSDGWTHPRDGWTHPADGCPRNAPPGGRMSRTPPRAAAWTALALLALVPVAVPPAHATPAAPSGAGAPVETGGPTLWYEVRGTAAGRPLVMGNGGPGFD